MRGSTFKIKPPFANYPRAELERLVQEGFDNIETYSAIWTGSQNWQRNPEDGVYSGFDFQLLMAADKFLRDKP